MIAFQIANQKHEQSQQKSAIILEAFIGQQKKLFKKKVIVDDSTQIGHLKTFFAKEYFADNQNPDCNGLIVVWSQIGLQNQLTVGDFKKSVSVENSQKIVFQIYQSSRNMLPITVRNKALIVWIDSNFKENKAAYDLIIKQNLLYHKVEMIQLSSNEKLIEWLSINEVYAKLLYSMRKIFFISNMNRPPNYQQEGVETFKIVRKHFEHQTFVFYIGDKDKCFQIISQMVNESELKNIQVLNGIIELNDLFITNFLNKLYLNQSGIHLKFDEV